MKERVISCIYMIRSKCKPERIYIGSAVNFYRRRREHLYDLRRGVHNPKLLNHYRKYGEGDLVFSIVAECDRSELVPIDKIIWIEQCFILAYKPWFNASPTAGSCIGTKASEETKRKIGEKSRIHNTGRRQPVEERRRRGNAQRGRFVSEETREKIRNKLKGNKPWNTGKGGTYTINRKEILPKWVRPSRFEKRFRKEELYLLDSLIEKMEKERENKVA